MMSHRLTEMSKEVATLRNAILDVLADAKSIDEDIDGDERDGRSVFSVTYTVRDIPGETMLALVAALGGPIAGNGGPVEAISALIEASTEETAVPRYTHFVDRIDGSGYSEDDNDLDAAMAKHSKAIGDPTTARSWIKDYADQDGTIVIEWKKPR